jgi:hypothetical protein
MLPRQLCRKAPRRFEFSLWISEKEADGQKQTITYARNLLLLPYPDLTGTLAVEYYH